ncbi:hypothetical protein HYDPIDRAFT_111341 [Hydnomerulius pinastri MD-312]|uniref:Uncharacterized protein n=1 Tax=Hydnomerulius pinastri MD-312 TaxID=994086 RepID=A0A0C9WG37_9AGAM|nr:hypothetical protein HYDPIDRAFT_111341 [Hydnomerulius pinastri MD-312]
MSAIWSLWMPVLHITNLQSLVFATCDNFAQDKTSRGQSHGANSVKVTPVPNDGGKITDHISDLGKAEEWI